MIRGILALSMLLVGCLLSGHVLAAPVTAPSSGSAIAGDVTTYILLDSPDVDDIEPYGIKSAALKKALRKVASMLRSSELEDVLGWLEKEAGIRAIKVVRKHAVTIANTLDSLAKWETVSMLIVREQLVAALQGVGLARSTCFEAAFWIEKFISWTML